MKTSNSQKILIGSGIGLCLAIALLILYLRPYRIADPATVHCHYMGYACGDCYPQYNIDSIAGDPDATALYKGMDLDIKWPDSKSETRFLDTIGIHTRHFRYTFTGKLMGYRQKEHLVMEVERYQLDTIHAIYPDSLAAEEP